MAGRNRIYALKDEGKWLRIYAIMAKLDDTEFERLTYYEASRSGVYRHKQSGVTVILVPPLWFQILDNADTEEDMQTFFGFTDQDVSIAEIFD